MEKTIVTLDVGTTSVKIGLYSATLAPLFSTSVEYALDSHGVCVEAPAQRYWEAVAEGVSRLPDRESVVAVAVTTQGETLLPVDAKGEPLCNAIVWLDSRAAKQAHSLTEKLGDRRFYETTGLPSLSGALPLAKLQWLREERPECYQEAYKLLLLEDYLLLKLTGRFVTEKSLLTSTGYFDLQSDDYWQEALDAAGIARDKLPDALECGVAISALSPACARELDLPPTAIVVTGAMDQTAAALAAGCSHPGSVCETTGTALVLAACTQAPAFNHERSVTIYRHAMSGSYLYLLIGNTAGMALKWFAAEFCPDLAGDGVYERINELCQNVPPGCEGVVFLPYLSGSADPDFLPNATACFFGARLSASRAHFARAILEAIGYQLSDFLAILRSLGCHAQEVVSLGGGAKSALWVQMKADVCGLPYLVPQCAEAASTGAAILGAWGAGLLPRGTLPPLTMRRAYAPREEARKAYRAQHERARRLYEAVKPLYE